MDQAIGSRAALLSTKFRFVDVVVPDVATFRLREMTGTERDKFEVGAFNDQTDMVDGKPVTRRVLNQLYLRARLVALCLVDAEGRRMFGDDEIAQLSDGVPTATLGVLFVAAQKLNGLDGAAVEEAEKNSVAAPTGASSSASPSP
jgi:hypothetical protein